MSHLRIPYDVIVVGARCAGAATALLLGRNGFRVLLVDRAAPGTDTLSTHALMRTGVMLLDRWGVLDDVKLAGTPPVTRSEFHYGDRATTVDVRAGHGVSALYAPRRTVLDALLVDAAAAAGVDVAFGVTVTGVERDDHGTVVGVVGHDRDRAPFRARAALTVGADGLTSTVAEAVGAPVRQRGLHAGALWYSYVAGLAQPGYRMFFRPGAVAGIIPTNDGASCVFAGMPAREFRVPSRADRWSALVDGIAAASPRAAAEIRQAEPVGAIRGWRGHPTVRRRAAGSGWALVGDAGYFKDPLTTHGISQALRDAQLLADAVSDAGCGGTPLSAALAGYEQARDRLSGRMFRLSDALASYDWDTETVQRLLRRLADEMSTEVTTLATNDTRRSARARTA